MKKTQGIVYKTMNYVVVIFDFWKKILTIKWPRGVLGTQDLFFAHFTPFVALFSPLFFLIV